MGVPLVKGMALPAATRETANRAKLMTTTLVKRSANSLPTWASVRWSEAQSLYCRTPLSGPTVEGSNPRKLYGTERSDEALALLYEQVV